MIGQAGAVEVSELKEVFVMDQGHRHGSFWRKFSFSFRALHSESVVRFASLGDGLKNNIVIDGVFVFHCSLNESTSGNAEAAHVDLGPRFQNTRTYIKVSECVCVCVSVCV